MNYFELQRVCEKRKLQIKDVVEAISMSYTGLRDAMNNGTLPAKKIVLLCKTLNIQPNEFFGWGEVGGNSYEQIGISNTQNVGVAGFDILREQLLTKDEQISKLLALLQSNTL